MSEEHPRQVEIDTKIGRLMGQQSDHIAELRRTLQREWELEELVGEYYTLLKVIHEEYWMRDMTPFWNKRRQNIQKRAEALGISHERRTEEHE